MIYAFLFLAIVGHGASQKIVTDYPTLPKLWEAVTNEPGAGKGIEAYSFTETPTENNPSAMWSNYTDCQRLIYVDNTKNSKRYLLGCESVNCCWEPQSGNQVEFQIPNVDYNNPSKNVDVYYQRANVTNFDETIEADEWSWSWTVQDKLSQDWRAYTLPCQECVNGVRLIQWQSRAMGLEWYAVEFRNYKGYDSSTNEGNDFLNMFTIPDVCKKDNLLECPSGLHDKYFSKKKCCDTCPEGTNKYYSLPVLSKNHCGESCIKPEDYKKFKLLEPKLTKADSETPCFDKGFLYEETEQHGFGPIKIDVDLYKKENKLKSSNCGTCGTAYQSCCIGFGLDGYPCDCHLQDGGSGKAGSECGDCGTAYSACCIGYAADGYPCECDVM
jgi:hypothetical protein